MSSPLGTKQILDLIKRQGVHPDGEELEKSLAKCVRWKMLKRSRGIKVRYSAPQFGITGKLKAELNIRIPPRRFTLPWLEKMADSLEAKRVELAGLISKPRYAKFPMLPSEVPTDLCRKQIKELKESPEAKRVVTKMLVDELRRDVFYKHSYLMDVAQDANDYLKALSFMNEYATLYGIPFAPRRWYPWFVKRLMNNITDRRRMPPFDAIPLWKDSYRECLNIFRSTKPTSDDFKKYHRVRRNLSWLNWYSE